MIQNIIESCFLECNYCIKFKIVVKHGWLLRLIKTTSSLIYYLIMACRALKYYSQQEGVKILESN